MRFPSVQYLEGESGQGECQGHSPKTKANGLRTGTTRAGGDLKPVHLDKRHVGKYFRGSGREWEEVT